MIATISHVFRLIHIFCLAAMHGHYTTSGVHTSDNKPTSLKGVWVTWLDSLDSSAFPLVRFWVAFLGVGSFTCISITRNNKNTFSNLCRAEKIVEGYVLRASLLNVWMGGGGYAVGKVWQSPLAPPPSPIFFFLHHFSLFSAFIS